MVEFYDPITKQNISYHIDKKLLLRWDKLRKGGLQILNEDRCYMVDGRERTGKSSFAIQQAKYLDPTLNVDRICFTPDEFLHAIRTALKGSCVVFDEAFRGLSSKGTRSKTNKAIVQALMEVGQRNLFIFIVLPTIFLLEIYAAVFRSECLFHIYKTKKKNTLGIRQRAFKIYNYNKKKQLYLRGKTKYFSYAYPRINMSKGRFFVNKNDKYPSGIPYEGFDMDAYLEKKNKAFESREFDEVSDDSKYLLQRNLIIKGLYTSKIKEFKSYRLLSKWLTSAGVRMSNQNVSVVIGKDMENPINT